MHNICRDEFKGVIPLIISADFIGKMLPVSYMVKITGEREWENGSAWTSEQVFGLRELLYQSNTLSGQWTMEARIPSFSLALSLSLSLSRSLSTSFYVITNANMHIGGVLIKQIKRGINSCAKWSWSLSLSLFLLVNCHGPHPQRKNCPIPIKLQK